MLKDILMIIGALASMAVIATVAISLWYGFLEWIERLKYNYRIKHRFDKPPTAKCYCVDCTRHDNESGRCYKFEKWNTADNWFCWDAEPRKKE